MTRSSRDESIHHHKHNRLPGVGQHKKKKKLRWPKMKRGGERRERAEGAGGGRTDELGEWKGDGQREHEQDS